MVRHLQMKTSALHPHHQDEIFHFLMITELESYDMPLYDLHFVVCENLP